MHVDFMMKRRCKAAMLSFMKKWCINAASDVQRKMSYALQWVNLFNAFIKYLCLNFLISNLCIWILNESFQFKTVFKTASENDDVIFIAIFIINQMKLKKKLMIATCMKDHLNNTRKFKSFNVQKLQLKNVRIMFKWYNQWRSELIVLDL